MWPEKNKIIARRFRKDLWNTGDMAIADQIIDSDCIVHARIPFPTDFATGPEAMKHLVRFYHLAFTDIEMKVEKIVAEDDMVAVLWSGHGRHTGDLIGVPATGREIVTSGIDMLRISDGRIVEGWVSWDALSLLEQVLGPERQEDSSEPDSRADFLALIARLQQS